MARHRKPARPIFETIVRMGAGYFTMTTTRKDTGVSETFDLSDRAEGVSESDLRRRVARTICSLHGIAKGGHAHA